ALVDEAQGRMHDTDMFGVDDLKVTAASVEDSAAPTTVTTADVDDELTLAKTLIAIKAAKPTVISTATTTITIVITTLRAKDQIALDEEVARKLEAEMKAEMKEEERIVREKDEANKAVIDEWDDVQAIITADGQKMLEQESTKKQKLAKQEQAKVADNDTAELKRCLEIVLEDDDDVAIEATPISSKSPTITKPVDDMDNLLFQTLKTMHVKDIIWKYQQVVVKVNNWKLLDSCGVYCVTTKNMVYYLPVEKMYPFTNSILHQLWSDVRLQVNYEVKMAYDLLRLIRRKINEGYKPE
nr:hypothetical protein [Tanacetum cinerariifolium]